jgi:hypothetical protein
MVGQGVSVSMGVGSTVGVTVSVAGTSTVGVLVSGVV